MLLLLMALWSAQAPVHAIPLPATMLADRAPVPPRIYGALPAVDFSPALNLLESVRMRVDPKTGKVRTRRRTALERRQEGACAQVLRSLQMMARSIS